MTVGRSTLDYAGATPHGRRRPRWSGSIVSGFIGAVASLIGFALAGVVFDLAARHFFRHQNHLTDGILEGVCLPWGKVVELLTGDRYPVLLACLGLCQLLAYGFVLGIGIDRRFALRALAAVAAVHSLAAGAFLVLWYVAHAD
jgi:hypothetical protein